MKFKNLHKQEQPLLLGNVWDVPSTKLAEKLHFQALGTSSSAIASLLEYKDGEEMKFSELEYMVNRIALNTTLPLSVDLESGYSLQPKEIANHIKRLVDIGVVGINIEDSRVAHERILLDADEFSKILAEVNSILLEENVDVFMNVRTDTFLLNHPNVIDETKKRIRLYEGAGAHGIFIPGIEKVTDIKEMVTCTRLPINVMSMPNLPDFETLTTLGVKRMSTGNFLFTKMYDQLENSTKELLKQKSFKSIFTC